MCKICEDPLFGLEAKDRQIKQGNINFMWLMDNVDYMHSMLCPDQTGTWQERVKQCCDAVKQLAGNKKSNSTYTVWTEAWPGFYLKGVFTKPEECHCEPDNPCQDCTCYRE